MGRESTDGCAVGALPLLLKATAVILSVTKDLMALREWACLSLL